MAYYSIKTDTDQLENCAKKIDNFIAVYDKKMNAISTGISGASSYWQGEEYQMFCGKWNEMKGGKSVSGKTRQALKCYAEYLRYAKRLYERAQQNAKNRARGL